MRLTPERIERFARAGYLFFPAHFRPEESAQREGC